MLIGPVAGWEDQVRKGSADLIPELSVVALRYSRKHKGKLLPEGAQGAVVHVYRDGVGYEVEFEEPFHCLVTIDRDDIRRV
jgi:hypothetical protein